MLDKVTSVGESLSNEVEEPAVIEPIFRGYQLIGDSQFLRFSETLLELKRKEKDGFSVLGLCVSGQKIEHLLNRVKIGFGNVSEKVVLMIGTNDLLRGTSFEKMRDDLEELLKLICQNAKKIVLLTLPPVLKLERSTYHWDRLKKFNEFIQQRQDGNRIFVGNAYAEFVRPKKSLSTPPSADRYNLMNSSASSKSMPCGDSESDLNYSANEDIATLHPPSSKRPRLSPLWLPNTRGKSSHNFSNSKNENEDCRSRAAKERCSWPSERTILPLMPPQFLARAPLCNFSASTMYSSVDAPMLSSVDKVVPSSSYSLTHSSSDKVTFTSDSIRKLSADAVVMSPVGPSLFPDVAATLLPSNKSFSTDKITSVGNVMTTLDNATALSSNAVSSETTLSSDNATSPSSDAASLSDITATPSGDPVMSSSDITSFLGATAKLSGCLAEPGEAVLLTSCPFSPSCNATSDSGGATPLSRSAVSPSRIAVSPSRCTVSPSHSAVSPSRIAVSPSRCAVSPSRSVVLPSRCAVSPSRSAVLPSHSAVSPSRSVVSPSRCAVSPSRCAVSPSHSAVLPSHSAVSPLGDAVSLFSGPLTSPGEAASLPLGEMTPSAGAVSPSDDVTLLSSGATTPIGCNTPSSCSVTTPSSGDTDPFVTPSEKKHRLWRKRNWYSRSNNRYYGSTEETEIQNADEINDAYFEEFYDNDCRRPDRIHLNADGLRVIAKVILDTIDAVDSEESLT